MADIERLKELLARIEKVTEPNRLFALHVVRIVADLGLVGAQDWIAAHGQPDASIDAALALVERCLPGWGWHFGRPLHNPQPHVGGASGYYGEIFRARAHEEPLVRGDWLTSRYAPTAPLAILAALLKALIASQTQERA